MSPRAWSRPAAIGTNAHSCCSSCESSAGDKGKLGEYLDWRFLTAVAIFVAVLFAHARIFGVSPFPGGWTLL